jgi:glycerophosphoryl diester phosphodiesterase
MTSIALYGHRGARGLRPENTLEGFAFARSLGLTGVEFDVGLSRDGVAVVHHDRRLNPDLARDAGGAYLAEPPRLRDLDYTQINHYDVGRLRPGSDYARRYPAQRPSDDARIPTLDQAIAALDGLDLLIEVKTFPESPADTAPPDRMAAAVIEALRRADGLRRSVLFAFDWRVLRAAATLAPDLRRCCLTAPDTTAADPASGRFIWQDLDPDYAASGELGGELPRAVAETGAVWWAPFHATLGADDVAKAHDLGLRVVPWTANEPADIERLLGLDVDGVISDRPDRACLVFKAAGCRILPAGGGWRG